MLRDAGIKIVLVLAGVVVLVAGLREAAGFFLPVLVAGFLAVVSAPLVRWLESRARMPTVAAIGVTFVAVIGVIAGLAAAVGGSLLGFNEAVPRYQTALRTLGGESLRVLRSYGIDAGPEMLFGLSDASTMMNLVAQLFQQLTSAVSNGVLVFLLLGFMLYEIKPGRDKLEVLLGADQPELARLAEAADELQTYLVVKSIVSLLTGLLCAIWYGVCGLDFAILWGLLCFLLNYIPTIGSAIAGIPPTLIALITLGPGGAAAVGIGHLTVNFVVGNVIEPRVMGRALGLSTLVVFLSMLFWGWLWGPVGALFGVPLTMVLKSVFASFEDTRWLAVVLGSRDWAERKRKEWGWFTREERETKGPHSIPPLQPAEGDVPFRTPEARPSDPSRASDPSRESDPAAKSGAERASMPPPRLSVPPPPTPAAAIEEAAEAEPDEAEADPHAAE